ncbi:MAG: SPASM domain-containing protein [Firmicutes bacterium]|nr:SPASM domain-containing protein [Bacillota bacterium]
MSNNHLTGIKSMKFSYPRWIVFQLLEKCNLRCKMCYEWGREGSYFSKKSLEQLDINVIKKVISDCYREKPYFELFGGEPLLYPQIDEVLSVIRHYGCNVDIPTNGTLIEKYAEMLVEHEPRRIWISIDGPEDINDIQRGKGVYKRAVAGIQKLHQVKKERGKELPMIGVTMVVTPLNYRYIEQFFIQDLDASMLDWISIEFQLYTTHTHCEAYERILCSQFGVKEATCARGLVRGCEDFDDINIKELIRQVHSVRAYCKEKHINVIGYPKTMDEENLKHFYSARWDKMLDKRARCSLSWLYVEIGANGDVTPCHTFYDYTVGNVYKESIADIWNGKKLETFRKYIRKNMLPICTACSRYYSDL